jgi:twinkle protein
MFYNQLQKLGIKVRRRSGQEKTVCPQCSESRRNKKDACLSVNVTEGTYNCHHCGWKGNVKSFERKDASKKYEKPSPDILKNIELSEKIIKYSEQRKLAGKHLTSFCTRKGRVHAADSKKERCIVFPYIRDGQVINAKYRDGNKNFRMVKDAELIFLECKHYRVDIVRLLQKVSGICSLHTNPVFVMSTNQLLMRMGK